MIIFQMLCSAVFFDGIWIYTIIYEKVESFYERMDWDMSVYGGERRVSIGEISSAYDLLGKEHFMIMER